MQARLEPKLPWGHPCVAELAPSFQTLSSPLRANSACPGLLTPALLLFFNTSQFASNFMQTRNQGKLRPATSGHGQLRWADVEGVSI